MESVSRVGASTFVVASCLLLAGCPAPTDPPPSTSATSGQPPADDEGGESPGICDQLLDDGGAGAGFRLGACPESVDAAVDFRWNPGVTVDYNARDSIYIIAENLTDNRVVLEYKVTANMVGSSETRNIPTPEQTVNVHDARFHRFNLQFGVELGPLVPGTVHVVVEARLLEPVRTEFLEVSDVDVRLQIDEDNRIYRIVYEAIEGEPV